MGTIYAISLVVGGILVLTSIILGGHGDFDADSDVDLELHGDIDAGVDLGIDVDTDVGLDIDVDADVDLDIHTDADTDFHGFDKGDLGDLDTGIWLPFFSLRFWIFGSAFFGLTGTTLSLLQGSLELSSFTVHLASALMGAIAGTGSAYLFRALQKQEVNSMVSHRQLKGRVAKVSLPVDSQTKGKVNLLVGDQRIDLIAATDDEEGFKRGDEAFIIEIKHGEARIVKMKELKASFDD